MSKRGFDGSLTRRRFLATTGGAAVAAAASSLPAPAVHAQVHELRFLNAEPAVDSVRALRVAAAQYERERRVKITIDTVPVGDAYTRMVSAIRGGKPYDIGTLIFVAHVLSLANEGQLTPITDLVNKYKWGKRILFPINGQHYWYMYDYNLCWLYYRKDLYDQLKLEPAKTWDQFLENSRKTMTSGANPRFGMTTPIGSNDATNWMSLGYLWASGVGLFDDKWNLTFDSPESRQKTAKFLDFFGELYKTMPPGLSQITFGNVLAHFGSEQAAHAPYAGRLIEYLEQRAPTLADKYGMMPYPDDAGVKSAVNHGYDGWVVGKTPLAEEAVRFMEWFGDAHYINFLHSAPLHFQPPRLDIYEDARWRAHPLIEKHAGAVKEMQRYLDDPNIVIRSIDTEGPAPDMRPAKIFESWILPEMLQSKVLKGTPSEQCVADAAERMRKLVA
ncbi:ABC transporter substrate-binding protein [Azospirillum sp.]|uniref:ABC transporter substrate-binding protein n=1 Tax=Azospirillum sp. TaxID=34012 RepID=UPI002D4F5E84|nr:extracellular solute-binding protein [Azospirillum sp.]HYD64586.1 extracellular solute-binding protein [Azospirillum sp.]